ncbi:MAG: hypothetical protein Q9199_007117 [Rusavskia elegans]
MKTPEAAICAWWEIAGHTWWGHHLSAAVFPSLPWEVGCVVDSALPVNGKPPRELTIEFPVKLEGIFPRSKAKADALSVKDSGEDPSPKKRPIQAQDLRQVQRHCTSSIRNLAISCPPFDRISNQRSPPPPYTSSVRVENERRGRRTRRDPKRTAHGHTHMPIPKITVDGHVEATTNVYCGPIIIDGS